MTRFVWLKITGLAINVLTGISSHYTLPTTKLICELRILTNDESLIKYQTTRYYKWILATIKRLAEKQ